MIIKITKYFLLLFLFLSPFITGNAKPFASNDNTYLNVVNNWNENIEIQEGQVYKHRKVISPNYNLEWSMIFQVTFLT